MQTACRCRSGIDHAIDHRRGPRELGKFGHQLQKLRIEPIARDVSHFYNSRAKRFPLLQILRRGEPREDGPHRPRLSLGGSYRALDWRNFGCA